MQKNLFHNLDKDKQFDEMLQVLILKGELYRHADGGYMWSCGTPLGEMPKKILPKCPECHKRHIDVVDGCDLVYGRRGWRQLGVYDG